MGVYWGFKSEIEGENVKKLLQLHLWLTYFKLTLIVNYTIYVWLLMLLVYLIKLQNYGLF